MIGGQNGEFAQLVKLSGSRSGFQWLGVSLTANEQVCVQNAGLLNARHKFNVDVEVLLRLPAYESHSNSRLICTAGAKETGAERRKFFNVRGASISVGKASLRGITEAGFDTLHLKLETTKSRGRHLPPL